MITDKDEMRGPYDDQVAFTRDAGALAKSLLSEGYKIMKIWPFDPFAAKTQGNWISAEDLEAGLKPFQLIRDAVGNKMEIMCELHSLWSTPAALRICKALEPYDIFWAEDPLCKMDDIQQIKELRSKTRTPICGSETLAGAVTFRQMFAAGAFDYAMLDLGWCGGLTEGRKIAALAESYNIPIAPHDCTGPVLLWSGLHLALNSPSGLFQEVVRANLATWYQDIVETLPVIENGHAKLPNAPGIGAVLRPEVKKRKDAVIGKREVRINRIKQQNPHGISVNLEFPDRLHAVGVFTCSYNSIFIFIVFLNHLICSYSNRYLAPAMLISTPSHISMISLFSNIWPPAMVPFVEFKSCT